MVYARLGKKIMCLSYEFCLVTDHNHSCISHEFNILLSKKNKIDLKSRIHNFKWRNYYFSGSHAKEKKLNF